MAHAHFLTWSAAGPFIDELGPPADILQVPDDVIIIRKRQRMTWTEVEGSRRGDALRSVQSQRYSSLPSRVQDKWSKNSTFSGSAREINQMVTGLEVQFVMSVLSSCTC
jgi:hypothetical protein